MGDLRKSMQKKVSGRRVHTSGESVLATLMKIYHGNRSFRLNIVVSTVSALTKKHNVFSFFFLDIVQDFVFELRVHTIPWYCHVSVFFVIKHLITMTTGFHREQKVPCFADIAWHSLKYFEYVNNR